MNERELNALLLVGVTVAGAFILSILTVPDWLRWTHPEWVTMVFVFWAMTMPHRIGVAVAFCIGLMLDIFEGVVLGEHGFALIVVSYICYLMYQRMRMYAIWQQSLFIFLLVGLQQLICHWVENIIGAPEQNLLFLLPALMSALFWPLVSSTLALLHRYVALN